MKVSNENKVLIGAGVVAVGGLAYLYWKKKQEEKQNEETPNYIPEETATAKSQQPTTATASLDRNRLLRKGSKGAEVRELQRLLGVKADGDFGSITLSALQKAKGISETSLNSFSQKTKAISQQPKPKPKALPKVGTKLMVVVGNTTIYNAKKIANGTYTNTGDKKFFGGTLNYGDYAGLYKSANNRGEYLIQNGSDYYFIKANSVTPY